MTIKANFILFVVLTIAQAIVQNAEIIPTEWRIVSAICQVIVTAIQLIYAGYKNPDGTPAEASWKPR